MQSEHLSDENPLSVFVREAPEVAASFDALVNSVRSLDGLDEKTKHLVYIGIKAALGDETAIRFHVPMARAAGATWEEVRDAILITVTVCGLKGVASSLPAARTAWDNPPSF